MMMKNKSKPKKVVIGIIIFILSCLYINGGYLFIKDTDDSPAKVVVADGIITTNLKQVMVVARVVRVITDHSLLIEKNMLYLLIHSLKLILAIV